MRPEERENLRYSKGSSNLIELAEEIMFSLLPQKKRGKLLDVGCGDGSIAAQLQKRGFEAYGIDFSSVAVERAKAKAINVIECDVDGAGIPFKDDFFDIVWAGDIIEHVFDPLFLLSEMRRVVAPEGTVLISIPNDMNLVQRFRIFFKGISPQSNIYRTLGQCKHHTSFSMELAEYMMERSGLEWEYGGFVVKLPRVSAYHHSRNRLLGRWFGQTFIIKAYKQ